MGDRPFREYFLAYKVRCILYDIERTLLLSEKSFRKIISSPRNKIVKNGYLCGEVWNCAGEQFTKISIEFPICLDLEVVLCCIYN